MVTKTLSILFVASEVEGLIKSGGLADVAKALPKSLKKLGHNVSIAMPAYITIPGRDDADILLSTKLEHWPHTAYQVRALDVDGVPVFAIECAEYFDRAEMYAENNQAYADNGERFAFFSAACLDMLPKLNIKPEIIHANDWHTGLVPYLLKKRYSNDAFFAQTRSVLSVHNAVFKGIFHYDEIECLSEFKSHYVPEAAVSHSHVSLLKAGVLCADKINAVSPTYAKELLTELGSHGMANEFQSREADLFGILNGCDYSEWSPEVDSFIPKQFKANRISMVRGKKACKAALQAEVNLPQKDVAVYGMVCRLTNQKGIHYLLPILEQFLKNDVQVVIVGTGDPFLANQLAEISAIHSDKFAFVEAYSNKLAHWVEAASDFFLMPSEFEPCGLNQIYSMAYGTLPIVREVGGLKDSVIDYDTDSENATGFSFKKPDPIELLLVLMRSLLLYSQDLNEVKRVQLHAMTQNFSWDEAADNYLKMYLS
ncbi:MULTISPECIES: glycogen synthase GlgA [Aliivibrio]|uniref:Glycogen synthase n=1 Tax=Aliivibrio finisterrensis TaxID=511998 RepID=A0A4Q5L1Z6_9GAMM|nr:MULTISPECIES: glycogen synthase GlgA [Aliivibrio]MDD9177191.1 glycogen synthase GlgA [Aliivibrio sp. A6]RYU51814.1 glycogen synthase GlgA [Aliivibrio finisterrensis]RYU54684.1 glycogen synthase GlgA [Aliivibrio finisterrensis]RYU57616.1 glycogen synthase GlgA [Aliivibrio finisterrensis]RYU66933.1 glycogen synthase GlgA [Aliivibrio finisterrensis]